MRRRALYLFDLALEAQWRARLQRGDPWAPSREQYFSAVTHVDRRARLLGISSRLGPARLRI
eukprot:1703782-Pyramimonas_sp.AAC.1